MTRASAVIFQENKVLLIHRKKMGREYWVFPGGKIEEGETNQEAVKREVLEETGLPVTKCTFIFNYTDEDKSKHPVFQCLVKKGVPTLGGPELENNSKDNWYHPEWIKIDHALKLNIYPEKGLEVLKILKKSQNIKSIKDV